MPNFANNMGGITDLNMILQNSSMQKLTLLLGYKIILDVLYVQVVYKFYAYMGFMLDFNIYKYLISIFLFFMLYWFLPTKSRRPSNIFLQLHFIVMIIPMLTLYSLANESSFFMLFSMACFMLQCLILNRAPIIHIGRIKNSQSVLLPLIILLSLLVFVVMIKANGFPSLAALNLNNVYNVRERVQYPGIMPYLVLWQGKVINPFLIAISFIKRNRKILILGVIMQLYLYLIVAFKSFLFIPLAIIIVIKILDKQKFFLIASLCAFVGSLFSYAVFIVLDNIALVSLFIRRFLFVPAGLKFHYYEFFSNPNHEFLYFSEGIIGKALGFKSPYDVKIANLIGSLYGGTIETNANTGYLADAYANMGVLGMFLITLLLIIVFMLIDSLSTRIDRKLVIGICIFPILSMNDSALLTCLLTGGLLMAIIFLLLYYDNNMKKVGLKL